MITKYKLYVDYGLGKWSFVQDFESLEAAVKAAHGGKPAEALAYMVYKEVTTTEVAEAFVVPAHVWTLEEIAEDIVADADGVYEIPWGEKYQALTREKKGLVEQMVWESVDSCACCGWYFSRDHLSSHDASDGEVCWKCYDDLDEEQEEDERSDFA